MGFHSGLWDQEEEFETRILWGEALEWESLCILWLTCRTGERRGHGVLKRSAENGFGIGGKLEGSD